MEPKEEDESKEEGFGEEEPPLGLGDRRKRKERLVLLMVKRVFVRRRRGERGERGESEGEEEGEEGDEERERKERERGGRGAKGREERVERAEREEEEEKERERASVRRSVDGRERREAVLGGSRGWC